MTNTRKIIAFQGEKGAYSDLACRTVYSDFETLPCTSFDDAFLAVKNKEADLAMIPVDNTLAGRVADVHHLLPDGELYIIGEHFQPIEHNLLGIKGTKLEDLEHVHSHIHAIPQCRRLIKRLGLSAHIHADTAGAAEEISKQQDKKQGAIASSLAAELYSLDVLEENVQDADHNTTRFLILSPEKTIPAADNGDTLSTLWFEVRNIPAALYKCLGGFATNGLSMAKLESYVDQKFQAARFYCDVEGHPESAAFKNAMEELKFYAKTVKFLGAYPAHSFRKTYKSGR